VGRIGPGPHLAGQIGSGVRVSASFQNYILDIKNKTPLPHNF